MENETQAPTQQTAPREPTNYLQFTDPEIIGIKNALEILLNTVHDMDERDAPMDSALMKITKHIHDFGLEP